MIQKELSTTRRDRIGLKRRNLLKFLVGVLLTAVVSVGSIGSLAAADQVTIRWSTWLGGSMLDNVKSRLEAFHRANPNIRVEVENYSGDEYVEKLFAMLATGTAPDVIHTSTEIADRLIASGYLLDVTKYVQRSIDMSQYAGGFSNVYMRDGRIWGGLETHAQVSPMYYNADYFDEAGLESPAELGLRGEWDWAAFRDAAKKLTRHNAEGEVTRWGVRMKPEWYTIASIVLSNGGNYISSDYLEITLGEPDALEALEFLRQLYVEDQVIKASIDSEGASFIEGQAAMEFEGSWNMFINNAATPSFKWDIALPPVQKVLRTERQFGADGLVTTQTAHPDEAWKLVEFFLSETYQMEKGRSKLEVPLLKSALESGLYTSPPPDNMWVIRTLLENSIPFGVFPGVNDLSAMMREQFTEVFLGEKSLGAAVVQIKEMGEARIAALRNPGN